VCTHATNGSNVHCTALDYTYTLHSGTAGRRETKMYDQTHKQMLSSTRLRYKGSSQPAHKFFIGRSELGGPSGLLLYHLIAHRR
jgi:hypothetical protein